MPAGDDILVPQAPDLNGCTGFGSELGRAGDILAGMMPITLGEMDSIRLMNRTDTKYMTDVRTLLDVLEKASASGYLVFENGGRVLGYRSMYYDTPQLKMYMDHHNGRAVRQKLRTRCYVSSGVTFLELKSKNNHGRTKKKRMEIPSDMYLTERLGDAGELSWLEGRLDCPAAELSPSLETVFSRITVVDPDRTERTTIDSDISFKNVRTGLSAALGCLSVIEVKQDGLKPSRLRDILLECRVKPFRLSKYCIGTALTSPSVRTGRFKERLIMINKMKEKYD